MRAPRDTTDTKTGRKRIKQSDFLMAESKEILKNWLAMLKAYIYIDRYVERGRGEKERVTTMFRASFSPNQLCIWDTRMPRMQQCIS